MRSWEKIALSYLLIFSYTVDIGNCRKKVFEREIRGKTRFKLYMDRDKLRHEKKNKKQHVGNIWPWKGGETQGDLYLEKIKDKTRLFIIVVWYVFKMEN